MGAGMQERADTSVLSRQHHVHILLFPSMQGILANVAARGNGDVLIRPTDRRMADADPFTVNESAAKIGCAESNGIAGDRTALPRCSRTRSAERVRCSV